MVRLATIDVLRLYHPFTPCNSIAEGGTWLPPLLIGQQSIHPFKLDGLHR